MLRACAAGADAHKSINVTIPHNAFRVETLCLYNISQHLVRKQYMRVFSRTAEPLRRFRIPRLSGPSSSGWTAESAVGQPYMSDFNFTEKVYRIS